MTPIHREHGTLHVERVSLLDVAARFGTPAFVYSRAAIEASWRRFDDALSGGPHLVCYAVKANSNLAVLDVLARLGSGFDIVSRGELERVLAAGGRADRCVFSGVGKRKDELERALAAGVRCFNVESAFELAALAEVAEASGKPAPVSLRINPDVDAHTHPYISTGLRQNKFGIPVAEAEQLYLEAAANPHLRVRGIDCHIGSQLLSTGPLLEALDRALELCDHLHSRGLAIEHLDLGGGIGVRYDDEQPPDLEQYGRAIMERIRGRNLEIILEPGRAVVAESGILIARVLGIKNNDLKRFAVVDTAMNDLLRPALYQGWHRIESVVDRAGDDASVRVAPARYDVVGPVCESADFLGLDRELAIADGDVLAIHGCGAYGFVMSSNYNSRGRAVELLVDGGHVHVARRREQLHELWASESRLPVHGINAP